MLYTNHNGKRLTTLFIAGLIFLSIFLPGVSAFADTREYNISEYIINIDINPDGSARIEEHLTYDFDGSFNGVFRDVDFSETGGFVNPEIYVVKDGTPIALTLYSNSNLDAVGNNGTYNWVVRGELAKFKIFEKSVNEKKTFIIRYTFEDVVSKYNDIAEFNRKIVDSRWDVGLNDISININLPEGAHREDIKVFGHGSLLGESEIISGQKLRFTVPHVRPGEMVETLVLFPTKLVPDAQRVVDKEALPEILANEKNLAEKANQQREEARRQVEREARRQKIGIFLAIVFTVIWFLIFLYIYFKYDKELKPQFQEKYFRELPGDYTPAEMSYLLSMGSLDTKDVTATLMDLVRKKVLLLTNEKYTKQGLFKNKEINEYIISLNPKKPDVKLKEHESYLIDWFIGTLGDGFCIKLNDIADYAKTQSRAKQFKQDYDNWCDAAKKEAAKHNFFDGTSKKGILLGMLISIAYFGLAFLLFFMFKSATGVLMFVLFLILLIFSARINRRSQYGNEQKAMWNAFKNFLKDFSRMDKAEMPSIIIWEHYLVYAISLGVAKEVIEQLPLVISETELRDSRLTYMGGYNSYTGLSVFSNTLDRTFNSVNSSINNAVSVANSTLSSSSGGGGGFSGGSSGGGGGGGGGGAF